MKTERNRAWRRFQDHVSSGRGMGSDNDLFKPEKKWKHMYLRKNKLIRAKQLGIDYPIRRGRQLLDQELPINK